MLTADDGLLKKVHGLSNLELAQLLCLTSRQHALISTTPDTLNDLVDELQLISTKVFGLKCVIVNCTAQTTLEDFALAIQLSPSPPTRSTSPFRTRSESYFPSQPHGHLAGRLAPLSPLTTISSTSQTQGQSQIANVILAKNLDLAPKAVQIEALELLRTRRIFTRTSVQTAPKQFLFLAVLGAASGGEARVTQHLNEFFFIAHWHDPEDGLANLEEEWQANEEAETASTESVVKKSSSGEEIQHDEPVFTEAEIASLAKLSQRVRVDVDVLRYQMNIIAFLRMHRAVAGGISPVATSHFDQLVKCLAPLHKLGFVTPALVDLAARKIYLHRIRIVKPENERSMQWGSELDAVKTILEGIGPEEVIEDVLGMVTAPV